MKNIPSLAFGLNLILCFSLCGTLCQTESLSDHLALDYPSPQGFLNCTSLYDPPSKLTTVALRKV